MSKLFNDLKRNVLVDPFNMTAREVYAQALMKCDDKKSQRLGAYIDSRLKGNYFTKKYLDDKEELPRMEICERDLKIRDRSGKVTETVCQGTCEVCLGAAEFCGVPKLLIGAGLNYFLHKGFVYSIGIPLKGDSIYAHKEVIALLKSQPIVDVHLATPSGDKYYGYFRPEWVKIDDVYFDYLPKKVRSWLGKDIMEEIAKWSDAALVNDVVGFSRGRSVTNAISYSIINVMRKKAKLPEITKPVVSPRSWGNKFLLDPEVTRAHYTQPKTKKRK